MLKNNKAFSLIELFAMILITTVIIYPLMGSLVSNIKINNVLQHRRSATSISSGTLFSIEKMDFQDIYSLVDNPDHFIDLNKNTCSTLASATDENLCGILFETVWNNLELEDFEYKVIIYNYYLPQVYLDNLTNNLDIPLAVRNEILLIPNDEVSTSTTLLRATVWIMYHNEPVSTMVLSGLIYDE